MKVSSIVVWLHGLGILKEFFGQISSLRSFIQFTMEIESSNMINFMDVLVIKKSCHQQLKFIENQPILAATSILPPIIHFM
jgi:hypothetical protein